MGGTECQSMADEKPSTSPKPEEAQPKFDPFKAEDPILPGVPRKTAAGAPAPATGLKIDPKDPKVLAGGALGLAGLVLLSWLLFGPAKKPEKGTEGAAAEATAPPQATTPAAGAPAAPAAVAPQIVSLPGSAGTLSEFPLAWSAKKIIVQRPTGRTPGLIIRLPGGNPNRADSYWGLLMMSPYGRCELEYLTDLKKITNDYGYRARHPMVVDPCNLTVFDPTRLGEIGGIVARGAVVQGTTLRPPLAMELKIENGRIMVLQTE